MSREKPRPECQNTTIVPEYHQSTRIPANQKNKNKRLIGCILLNCRNFMRCHNLEINEFSYFSDKVGAYSSCLSTLVVQPRLRNISVVK